jgi:hypothetical protein
MRLPSLTQIQASSSELNSLNRRFLAAVPERGELWRDLCEEFHRRYDELYFPGGSAALRKVREQDPSAVESAVRFLLADPYHFRSGYVKEYLWRWLVHIQLTSCQRTKLEQAALKYVERKVSREFWSMAKAMHRLGRPEFWMLVGSRVNSAKEPERSRALLLLLFGANVHTGAMARQRIFRRWLMENFGGS